MNVSVSKSTKKLTADSGKWLTDGVSYAQVVYLPAGADETRWSEVAASKVPIETEVETNGEKRERLAVELESTNDAYALEIEDYLAEAGNPIAVQRKALRNQIDALGKVVQTATGNGSMEDPYKTWKVGIYVTEGDWWMTEGGYLWQVKKSGNPSSETDSEYFDVVGL